MSRRKYCAAFCLTLSITGRRTTRSERSPNGVQRLCKEYTNEFSSLRLTILSIENNAEGDEEDDDDDRQNEDELEHDTMKITRYGVQASR